MPLVLGVSTLIAVMVYRFTRRQAQVEALKLLNSRWHDINRILMERPHIQRLLGDARLSTRTDDEIIVFNFLFQVLNICHEIHFAKERGLIDKAVASQLLQGNLDVLRGKPEQVLELLSWNRGYGEDFCRLVSESLRSTLASPGHDA
jgi:hypothetical protein